MWESICGGRILGKLQAECLAKCCEFGVALHGSWTFKCLGTNT